MKREQKLKKKINRVVCLILCVFLVFMVFGAAACKKDPVKIRVIFVENIPAGVSARVDDFPDPETIYIESGSKVAKPSNEPKISGYKFDGWYKESAGTNEFDFDAAVTSDTNVFAKWSKVITRYDVYFDLNYVGAPLPQIVSVVSGEAVDEPVAPQHDGYRFGGWSLTETGTGGIYNFSMKVTSSIILYAIWTKVWKVTFDYNYNNAPSPETQIIKNGESADIFTPGRDDWTFTNWYEDKECSTEYEFGPVTSDITVYAGWTAIIKYTITFNLNYEDSPEPPAPQTVTGSNGRVTEPDTPERDGYDFDGWYTSATGGILFNFNNVISVSRTLHARWTKLWTFTFDFNFDGAAPQAETVRNGESVENITVVLPTHPDGWSFGGWYEEALCQNEYDLSAAVAADTTVYAKWIDSSVVGDEFTITFDLNYDGATDPPEPQTVTGGTITKPVDPVRDAWSFDGWYTQPTGGSLFNFNVAVTESRTLFARWTKLWTVTFNFNLTGVDPAAQTVRQGSSANPNIVTAPTHPQGQGWSISGWYEEAECVTEYGFGAVNANITIYAKWVQTTVTVTFDLNYEGAPAATTQQVAIGSSAVRPDNPSRNGYTFANWYTQAKGTTPYGFGAVTQSITVYARWYVTLSVDLNYANAPVIANKTYFEGDVLPAPDTPARANNSDSGNPYIFIGWATASDSSTIFNGFGTPITGSLKLYAQWKHNNVLEAEYTYLDDLQGVSVSGQAIGTAMIIDEEDYENPVEFPPTAYSNGYAVAYLYGYGLALTFDFTSDRDAQVSLAVRLTCEFATQTFTGDMYTIEVNGTNYYLEETLNYNSGYVNPCKDIMFTVQVKKGDNRIRLITTNTETLDQTMGSHAPIVDCIKIETDAKIAMFTIDTIGEHAGRRIEGPRYSNKA